MAIGKQICCFRKQRNMTQKQLGILAGFPEKSADVRISQYESGARSPKGELLNALAVPHIDYDEEILHFLFWMEDAYGLKICISANKIFFELDQSKGGLYEKILECGRKAAKRKEGEITKEEYNEWRYRYPQPRS